MHAKHGPWNMLMHDKKGVVCCGHEPLQAQTTNAMRIWSCHAWNPYTCSCMVHESCMHESKHHAAATLMDMSHCNPCQICKHKRHFKDMQMPACMKTISIFIWMTLYQYPKYSCDSKRSAIAICNSPFTNFDKKEIWTPNATLLTIFTRSLQFLCSEFGFGW